MIKFIFNLLIAISVLSSCHFLNKKKSVKDSCKVIFETYLSSNHNDSNTLNTLLKFKQLDISKMDNFCIGNFLSLSHESDSFFLFFKILDSSPKKFKNMFKIDSDSFNFITFKIFSEKYDKIDTLQYKKVLDFVLKNNAKKSRLRLLWGAFANLKLNGNETTCNFIERYSLNSKDNLINCSLLKEKLESLEKEVLKK